MLYRVEGIVIRSIEYGEGNVIITLFTEEYGKVGVMVRGAKKARSRHAAVTQLYTYGEYVYYKSNTGTLGTLNNAELLDAFIGIRSDLRSSAYAAYFAELTDRLVPDGEASGYLFEQLKAGLASLNEGKDPQIIAFLLEMKLFRFAGISPVADACASCDRVPEPEEPVVWSVQAGGLVCRRCAGRAAPDGVLLQPAAARLLPLLQRADLRRIGDIRVKLQTKMAIKQAMRSWMDTHADVRLKTRTVLEQIEAVFDTDA
jgi:DNA repair protein RecO (recombination protein O)